MDDPNNQGTPPAQNGENDSANASGTPPENKPPEGTPPANTESASDKNATESRINQLLARAKKAEDELKTIHAEREKAEKENMLNRGEHEKVIAQMEEEKKGYLEQIKRTEKLEAALNSHLESQLALIPAEKQKLIPSSYSVEEKLTYIAENASLLISQTPKKDVGAAMPNGEGQNADSKKALEERFDVLVKKGTSRTYQEQEELMKITKQLKEAEKK